MDFYSISKFTLDSKTAITQITIEQACKEYDRLQDEEGEVAKREERQPRLILYPYFKKYLDYCLSLKQMPDYFNLSDYLFYNYNSGSLQDKLYSKLACKQLGTFQAYASVFNTQEFKDYFTKGDK